jgi:hypothetical protein
VRPLRERARARARAGAAHLVLVGHQACDHGGVEPGVDMAPKDGRGHVEPAPDFALREAVDVLGEVVRQPSARARVRIVGICICVRAVQQRRAGDDAKAQQERADEGRDERGGGAHAGLVHIPDRHAGPREPGEQPERGGRGGQVPRVELLALGVEIVVAHDRDVEPRAQNGSHAVRRAQLADELESLLQGEMYKFVCPSGALVA